MRTVTLAVIASQLDVASNLSNLCRKALSAVQKEGGKPANHSTGGSSGNGKASESIGGSGKHQAGLVSKNHPADAHRGDSSRFVAEVLPLSSAAISKSQGGMLGVSRRPAQSYAQPELDVSATTTYHGGTQSPLERGGVRQQSPPIEDPHISRAENGRRGEEVQQQQSTAGKAGYAFYKVERGFDAGNQPQGIFADGGAREDAGRRPGLISHEDNDNTPARKENPPPTKLLAYPEGDSTTVALPDNGTSFHRQGLGEDEVFADGVASVHARGQAALLASTLEPEVLTSAGLIREEAETAADTSNRGIDRNGTEANGTRHQPGVAAQHPLVEGAGQGTALAADGSALLESVTAGTNTVRSGIKGRVDRDNTGGMMHTKAGSSVASTDYLTSKADERLRTRQEDEDWNDHADDEDDDDDDDDQGGDNWSSWLRKGIVENSDTCPVLTLL